jgi:hypothetical protein
MQTTSVGSAHHRSAAIVICASLLLAIGAVSGCASPQTTDAARASLDAGAILRRVTQASFRDVTFTYASTVMTDGKAVQTTGSGALTATPRRVQYKLQTPMAVPCVPNTDLLTVETVRDDASHLVYSRQGHSMDRRTCQAANILSGWQTEEYIWPQVNDVDVTGLSELPSPDLAVAQYVGDETVDGASVYHLRVERSYTSDGAIGTPAVATITTDIYINRETAHPAKIVRRVSQGDAMTLSFTAYDTGVTIDLPQVS